MVCTTVTVTQAKPIVSSLVVTNNVTQPGRIDMSWYQDIAGNISITVGGTVVNQGAYPAGTNINSVTGLSPGSTYNICVVAT